MAQRVATGGHGAVTSGLVASTSLHGNGGATYISNDDDEDDNEWHELHELEAQLANETQNNEDFAPSRNIGNGARYAQVPTDENDDKLEHKAGSRLNAPPSNDDPALAMVRAVVKETDDPSLPNVTFRVLLLGTILCAVGAAVSQLFFFKSNAPSFSNFLIILLSYPAGHWLAQILPERYYNILGYTFTLNPGPFGVKEHVLILAIAGSGSGSAYGADIITIQDLYYHQDIGPVGGILLLLSTQILGFGLSGLVHNLLVRPSKMVWPATLVPISLFNTLHGDSSTITRQRLRFFKLAFLAIFAWQFMPTVFAPILTSFATLCLINNNIPAFRALGSGYSGFGWFNISFDWSVIGSQGGLFTPWFASLNRFGGFFTAMGFIAPLMYFTNFWGAKSFDSVIGPGLYDRNHRKFDITKIIDPQTLSLDSEKWEQARPLLLTPWFGMTYALSFAVLSAVVVSILLWHWADIRDAFLTSRTTTTSEDIHVQMMEASYEPVPASWYAYAGISMIVAAVVVVVFYPMQLPVWALLLSLLVALVFLPACGIIAATTGTVIGLNVITEFIAGLLLPGLPIANVTFKCYGYMVMSQALALVADLKLALYCKIKPKAMFGCQLYGTALGAIVNYIYVRSVIASKREFLDGTLVDPTGQWTGRSPKIFYSASVIWGLVGPARFFVGNYRWLYLGFPVGAILPLIPWYLSKKYPNAKWLTKVSVPLILDGTMQAPQTPTNVLIAGFLSAFLSQRYALRKYPQWYEKYNFVLSAALDAGTSIQALVVYIFGIGSIFAWWGNSAIDTEHCTPGS